MMTAALLREAAALIRSRAATATPGPWEVLRDEDSGGLAVYGADHHLCDVSEWSRWLGNAEHIASWHSLVALSVAQLLENEASLVESVHAHPDLHQPINNARLDLLSEIARTYLGRSS